MKPDGGPAFPEISGFRAKHGEAEQEIIKCNPGMSLRDYFAAKAMAELIQQNENMEIAAKLSYRMADEMLKARE